MKNIIKRIYKWICSIKADKLLHFIAGLLIAQIICVIMSFFTSGYAVIIIGFASSIVICAAKELIYDLWMHKGTADFKDFLAGFVGAFIGTLIVYLII